MPPPWLVPGQGLVTGAPDAGNCDAAGNVGYAGCTARCWSRRAGGRGQWISRASTSMTSPRGVAKGGAERVEDDAVWPPGRKAFGRPFARWLQ